MRKKTALSRCSRGFGSARNKAKRKPVCGGLREWGVAWMMEQQNHDCRRLLARFGVGSLGQEKLSVMRRKKKKLKLLNEELEVARRGGILPVPPGK